MALALALREHDALAPVTTRIVRACDVSFFLASTSLSRRLCVVAHDCPWRERERAASLDATRRGGPDLERRARAASGVLRERERENFGS